MTRIYVTGAIGLVLSGIFGYLLLPVLRAMKAGQSIREVGPTWHNNKMGTPMMGGLMFIAAVIVCLLGNLNVIEDNSVFFVLMLSLAYGFIGFLDDYAKIRHKKNLGLTALQKILLQLAVALLFLYTMYKNGSVTTALYLPFFNTFLHVRLRVYLFLTMFVMVGCVNAVNLTDGIDGLSSSVTIPVMVFFVFAAVKQQQYDLALLPAALIGGLIAYLFYNWHPAKVFMGDTGSLFLGGVVSAMAIALDMPLILILVGFVYICETLSVILQVGYFKLTHGKRLFKMSPIHHHFELCGWKEERIVLTFAGVSALMCVLAWISIINMA